MIAVAGASIPLAIWATLEARRERFLHTAAFHESQIVNVVAVGIGGIGYGSMSRTPQDGRLSMFRRSAICGAFDPG